jgi:leucyl aminopeptidase
MRVATGQPQGAAVRASVDERLRPGELRWDGDELRVGAFSLPHGDGLRAAAARAARALRHEGGTIRWRAETAGEVRALVEGSAYGAYDTGLFKNGYAARPELVLALDIPPELEELAQRQALVSRHVDAVRDLGNRPPNDLTPEALAAHAVRYAGGGVESHGRDWIEARGMGAFAAVAAGSAHDPQLIVMHYDPPGARADVTLGLVGKALTFDSGGISLKPHLRMQDMKGDMCGGAAVIEATAAIAELGLPLRVVTVVASTENVQDGSSFKPGDIVRATNGKTIEVVNTDAEGRLVLADALHYAREAGATHLVDLATLTGSMTVALGDLYAGYFANDDELAGRIDTASAESGDLAWRFPLHPRYRRYVDSDFADVANLSELGEAGAVYAAEFLREFTGEGPWAHFDLSPAYVVRPRPDYVLDQGATGYGVRLLVELAAGLA